MGDVLERALDRRYGRVPKVLHAQPYELDAIQLAVGVGVKGLQHLRALVGVEVQASKGEQRLTFVRINEQGRVLVEQEEQVLKEDELPHSGSRIVAIRLHHA